MANTMAHLQADHAVGYQLKDDSEAAKLHAQDHRFSNGWSHTHPAPGVTADREWVPCSTHEDTAAGRLWCSRPLNHVGAHKLS